MVLAFPKRSAFCITTFMYRRRGDRNCSINCMPTKEHHDNARYPTKFEPLFHPKSGVEYGMGEDRHVVMRLQAEHTAVSTTPAESDALWAPIVLHPHRPAIAKLGFSQGTDAALPFRSSTKEAR